MIRMGIAASMLATLAPGVSAPSAERPNILWIVAENVKLDFGC
jgi:hypothetical protein